MGTSSFRFLLQNKIMKEDSEFPLSAKRYHLMRYVRAEDKIVMALQMLERDPVDLTEFVDFKR